MIITVEKNKAGKREMESWEEGYKFKQVSQGII